MTLRAMVIRVTIHLLLFLLALTIFYLGLGLGLSVNPLYGNMLWITALIITGFNVMWIARRLHKK